LWQVEDPAVILVQSSREYTTSYLSTGISNLLQPAQAEVVLGHPSTYLAYWVRVKTIFLICKYGDTSVMAESADRALNINLRLLNAPNPTKP
jgi:hypothetical protein